MAGSVSERLARNATWSVAGLLIPVVLLFLTVPIYIRHLGLASFGKWSAVTGLIGMFGALNFELGTSTTKFVAQFEAEKDEESVSATVTAALLLFVVISGVATGTVLLAAPWLSNVIFDSVTDDDVRLLRIVGAGVFPTVALPLLWGILNGRQLYSWSQGLVMARTFLMAAIGVASLMWGGGLLVFARSQIGMLWAIALATAMVCVRHIHAPLRFGAALRVFPDVFRFGMHSFAATLGSQLVTTADRLIVSAILGPEAVAFYTVPQSVAYRIHALVLAVSRVLLPHFSSNEDNDHALAQAWAFSIAVAVALGAGLFAGGPWLLEVWTGETMRARAAFVMGAHVITWSLAACSIVPYLYFFGKGRPAHAAFWVAAGTTSVLATQSLVANVGFGLNVIALCTLCFPLALFAMDRGLVQKSDRRVLGDAWWVVVLGVVPAAAGFLAAQASDDAGFGALASLAVAWGVVSAGLLAIALYPARGNLYSQAVHRALRLVLGIVGRA